MSPSLRRGQTSHDLLHVASARLRGFELVFEAYFLQRHLADTFLTTVGIVNCREMAMLFAISMHATGTTFYCLQSYWRTGKIDRHRKRLSRILSSPARVYLSYLADSYIKLLSDIFIVGNLSRLGAIHNYQCFKISIFFIENVGGWVKAKYRKSKFSDFDFIQHTNKSCPTNK